MAGGAIVASGPKSKFLLELKRLLVLAIQGEVEGRELYLSASERTKDRKAKKVFLNLSQEEDSHIKALQEIAEKTCKGEKVSAPAIAPIESFSDAQSPIFTPEFKASIKDKRYEVSKSSI